MRLKNKLAVITGGSDGIGFGIAQAYGREGARLCLVARTAKSLSAAKAKLEAAGAAVSTVQADLVADDAVEHVAAAIKALGQPVDVLVNNAGMAALVPFMEATRAQYELSLRLNVTVPFFLTQAVVPSMAPGAAIINISSYFAHKMLPGRPSSIYSLTKGALNSLTKAMAWELAARDIRVNAIAPGTCVPRVGVGHSRISTRGAVVWSLTSIAPGVARNARKPRTQKHGGRSHRKAKAAPRRRRWPRAWPERARTIDLHCVAPRVIPRQQIGFLRRHSTRRRR